MLPFIMASCTFKEKEKREIVIDSTSYAIHEKQKYIEIDSMKYCYTNIAPVIYPGSTRGLEIETYDKSGNPVTVVIITKI